MPIESIAIEQSYIAMRNQISQLSGSTVLYFLQMLSWHLLCDRLFKLRIVFMLIYISEVAIGSYILSKWLEKTGEFNRI